MTNDKVVHESEIEVLGDRYEIIVFCRHDGRHFAKTRFGEDDIIINDGATLEDALTRHEKLLPLAISSRQMFQKIANGQKKPPTL